MNSPEYTCVCYSLRALNIIDYNARCFEYLSIRAPKAKWALLSLESLALECKTLTDRNDVEFDYFPLFHFLKELPTSLIFEIRTLSLLTKLKYLYYKRKLLSLLRDNFFNEYSEVVQRNLKTCRGAAESEVILRKLARLFHVVLLNPELTSQDMYRYEFMAEVLNFCYDENIQDNELVIDLLKITIKMYVVELFDARNVRQPEYTQGFLKYILEHAAKAGFDVCRYINAHPRTMWEYSSNFYVVNSVSIGNIEKTLLLLQYGIEVFSERDIRKCGHGFPFIEETIPPAYLMVFHMMSNMSAMNNFIHHAVRYFNNNIYQLTRDQMECFRLIWRSIPTPFVKQAQMASAITNEFFHLTRQAIFNPTRYEKNTKFSILYETSFVDLASGPTEPRQLKHLSRCTIRDCLRQQRSLPSGICKLSLPTSVQRYLNLEYD
ncbi:hypothetical protein JTE90_007898 [Oedothorax gibbosus]|uniref:SOCS box domain-containing protein n=1 Tax=Oedothorax gibbosus TaxID=931172 RepID=A0AAV6VJ72_9ARAC|nr:hypothetical protein JTE90_007898 [Oedothorax gibbosus]